MKRKCNSSDNSVIRCRQQIIGCKKQNYNRNYKLNTKSKIKLSTRQTELLKHWTK
jgi:hypothetical protein